MKKFRKKSKKEKQEKAAVKINKDYHWTENQLKRIKNTDKIQEIDRVLSLEKEQNMQLLQIKEVKWDHHL
jgi:hypothetical protein